ncbi:DNA polymerase IV [Candidatus Bandiella numerosa]|uniref:DNA polymerase IV n=1 Tax=Candidatus Bandiella numerosa TaxID=2570586 RepID=UPI001F015C2F|nr:DNA polymerase IV [Candidatus Bandiella numerosa]
MIRKIIHIDMDSFYASVEIRDNPALLGKPVAIGSKGRGVLCTCNYEARKYGIHSAMPTYKALNRCPSLILLPVNMAKYKEVSYRIRDIFRSYSDKIELLSLDEAYLDVSNSSLYHGSATLVAQAIREKIYEKEKLTSSAGIAPNKFLAKIASDWNKPNGQFVITPSKIAEFINSLDVKKIFGVGKVTLKKLRAMEINTCSDLQKLALEELVRKFGSYGTSLYYMSRGIDDREVKSNRRRKSFSFERTFEKDLTTIEQCYGETFKLYEQLNQRLLEKSNISGTFVKLKFSDFTSTTAEEKGFRLEKDNFYQLLLKAKARSPKKHIRLIGLGVRLRDPELHSSQCILQL